VSVKRRPGRPRDLQKAERALELRRDGLSYAAIAKELQVTPARAYNIIQKALSHENFPTVALEVREMELERLEWMWARTCEIINQAEADRERWYNLSFEERYARRYPSFDDKILRALDRALVVDKRRAEFLGIDAPQRQIVQVVSQEAINADIARMAAQLGVSPDIPLEELAKIVETRRAAIEARAVGTEGADYRERVVEPESIECPERVVPHDGTALGERIVIVEDTDMPE
jgi:hypothetical protein